VFMLLLGVDVNTTIQRKNYNNISANHMYTSLHTFIGTLRTKYNFNLRNEQLTIDATKNIIFLAYYLKMVDVTPQIGKED
jgi:hypothetical protein